jgi:FlaA1/EpsC-like NDP-sugar epimerase
MVFTTDLYDFNRSVFIIDALICVITITGSRFAERTLLNGTRRVRDRTSRRTLIVGAGRTGRGMMRELRETAGERVVGFVDDNPHLRRRSVHGVKVVGTSSELERLLARTRPDIVLVTIPDAPRETLDAIVAACSAAEVPCRFVRRETDLDPRVILGSHAE